MTLSYTVKLEADFTGNNFGTTPVWTDISKYLLTTGDAGAPATVTGGRQDRVSQVSPSVMTLRLDNDDLPNDPGGRFSPDVTGLVNNLLSADLAAPGCVSRAPVFTPVAGYTLAFDNTGKLPGSGAAVANPCSQKVTVASGTNATVLATSKAAATVGLTYAMRAQINNSGGSIAAKAQLAFLNAAGGVISTVDGTVVAIGATGYSTAAGVAPALTVSVTVRLTTNGAPPSTMTYYAGNLDIEAAGAASFEQVQPFYPQIDVGVPMRLTVNLAGTDYRIGFGVVKNWEPAYVANGTLVTTVTCTDILGRMGTLQRLRDWLTEELLAAGATALYPLQEVEGSTTFGDITGNHKAATIRNAKLAAGTVTAGVAAAGLAYGTGVSITWPGVLNQASSIETGVPAPSPGPFTIVICTSWARLTTMPVMVAASNGNTFATLYLGPDAVSGLDVEWSLTDDAGNTAVAVTSGRTAQSNDGQMHCYVATLEADLKTAKLYIDGVLVGTITPSAAALGTFSLDGPLQVGGFIDPLVNNPYTAMASGTFAFFGVLPTAVTATQAANFSAAALTAFSGEATGAHAQRLISYRPNYGSTIDAGRGTVGSQDIRGVTPQAALLDTVKAENGYLYADGNGKIVFLDRGHLFNPAVAVALDGALEQVTADGSWPKSDQYVENDVTLTRVNGADSRVIDTTSTKRYGVYATSDTVICSTDLQALDVAGWRVSAGKTPKSTPPAITVDLLTETSAATAVSVLSATPLKGLTAVNLPKAIAPVRAVFQGWSYTIAIDNIRVAFNTTPMTPAVMTWDSDAAHGWDNSVWGF